MRKFVGMKNEKESNQNIQYEDTQGYLTCFGCTR